MDRAVPLPHNLEAEAAVLGTILNNNQTFDIALETLKTEDFYSEKNRLIFKTFIQLHSEKSAIDILTTSNILENKLKNEGGITYLAQLAGSYSFNSNIKEYCLIIKDKSNKRKIIEAANNMILKSYNDDDTNTILDYTQNYILNISDYKSTDICSAEEVALNSYKTIENNYKNGGGLIGLSTKLRQIDDITCGLQKGDYILVAARPSIGKTALMLTLGLNVAIEGKSVLIFSLEMVKEQLMDRLLSNITNINLSRLRKGELVSKEWDKLAEALNYISSKKIFFDDKIGQTVHEMKSKAKAVKQERGLDLILIDYIGKIESSERKNDNRQQELGKISSNLKDMAKELQVPVVVLSQLSRACEARTDKRPILSDLRDSGSLEQDADIVFMLYRDEYYDKETEDKNILEVITAKNRNGESKTVKLAWMGETQRISNIDVVESGGYNPEIFEERESSHEQVRFS